MSVYRKYCLSLLLPLFVLPILHILHRVGQLGFMFFDLPLFFFLLNLQHAYIQYLPLLYAASFALCFAYKMDGTSILSGIIAYLVVTQVLKEATFATTSEVVHPAFTMMESPFLGILCGGIAALIYNRFATVQLPQGLAFFSGRRLVPIVTGCSMIFIAGGLFFIWPWLVTLLETIVAWLQQVSSIGDGLLFIFQKSLFLLGLAQLPFIPTQPTFTNLLTQISAPIVLALLYFYCVPEKNKYYTWIVIISAIGCSISGDAFLLNILILLVSPLLYLAYILLGGMLIVVYNNSEIGMLQLAIVSALLYGFLFFFLTFKKTFTFTPYTTHSQLLEPAVVNQVLAALGGFENILHLEQQGTHIIIHIIDISYVDASVFFALGYGIPKEQEPNIVDWEVGITAKEIAETLKCKQAEELQSLIF